MTKVVQRIFEEVANVAPHISEGMLNRREYMEQETNPSDEEQLEADVWANQMLKEKITEIPGVGMFASEEEEEVTECGSGVSVTVDPLDGSSNIPSNNLVGIIIGIYDDWIPCKGKKLIASFYVTFGPLTTMVKAENGQVNEYVIEKKKQDQVEIHKTQEDLELPDTGKLYGFGGMESEWTEKFQDYAKEVRQNYKLRYGGALVGDINQIVHYGGVFAYPSLQNKPSGKLRLMFEANPMAYIIESMGGRSSNGMKTILHVEPEELHQRTPVHLGNHHLIKKLEETYTEHDGKRR